MNEKRKFFLDEDVAAVLEQLVDSFNDHVFPEGCPDRPSELSQEMKHWIPVTSGHGSSFRFNGNDKDSLKLMTFAEAEAEVIAWELKACTIGGRGEVVDFHELVKQEGWDRDFPFLPAGQIFEKEHQMTSSGQSLEGEAFRIPPLHIPVCGDEANARHSYKSELTLVRDPDIGTKKLLWWHDKDPRDEPHNHPWDFRSAIISGGYTEERFWIDEDGKVQRDEVTYEAGQINVVPANVYHNVISVEPGTVTYLDCGPARTGNEWGYLDIRNGEYITFKDLTPDNFLEMFQGLNPHTRPH